MNEKCVVMGICGGIAAYKSCEVVRLLAKDGFDVHCILTEAGAKFITPLTLQTLSQNAVHTDMWNLIDEAKVGHISLADRASAVIVAPATADIIAKVAAGICDDLLSTVICATKAPVVFAPSMNVHMWENKITQRNIRTLKEFSYKFIEPDEGPLACGYDGKGRMASPQSIFDFVKKTV
jgi:phosphopantothenoylcysteine decarboxylase/phosphopantothenate--cysteine ligase